MRVIGGRCRGMRLRSVPGMETRPTTDRVRESLFNILAPWVPGARVLDLFAGTGALGIEALSRGAREAVFVERNPRAVRVLRANLDHTGLAPQAQVRVGDAVRELARLGREGRRFDLVFLDPPYGRGLARDALLALAEAAVVAGEAWVVVEHSGREEMPERAANLAKARAVRYGDTVLTFYRPTAGSSPTAAPEPGALPRDGQPETGGQEGGA
ncbi:MAG: 16S rRNA (guanine(966)-N(2))-methyltransferase RsmD [Limnochordales bacterium]|nr:16S rRNA (guanine(966)-N(2))-methyltransferase RsmD [Limnochordales bacterium]